MAFSVLFVALVPRVAQPLEINIRAHSELKVGVSTAGTLVRVSGALQDSTGRGLPQRAIDVDFAERSSNRDAAPITPRPAFSKRLFSGRDGVFQLNRELPPGHWRVTLRFAETPHLTGAHFQRDIEVRQAPARLRLQLPAVVLLPDAASQDGPALQASARQLEIPARIQATVEGVGLPEVVRVLVDSTPVDTVELDAFGRATLPLQAHLGPGFHQVRAELVAPRYADAEVATRRLRVSETIDIQAQMHEVVERLRRGFTVSGRVSDPLGPLPGAELSVQLLRRDKAKKFVPTAKKHSLSRVVRSDENGEFSAFFPSADLPDGLWFAELKLLPQVGRPVLASVEPIDLDRTTSRWVLNILGVLGFLGGFGLLVQRFWQVIHTYWVERRRQKASRERVESAMSDVETLAPAALEPTSEDDSDASTQRNYLSGRVWDRWKERPVSRAELHITRRDGQPVLVHSIEPAESASPAAEPKKGQGDGCFHTGDLPDGRYRMEIRAPGFMPSQLDFRLPHYGQFSHMRLDLIAIPLKIRRLYQSLVEALEGDDLWGSLSPHEIERALQAALQAEDPADESDRGTGARRAFVAALKARLRSGEWAPGADSNPERGEQEALSESGGAQLLALMTAVVEETYFSGRTFDMAVWRLARDIAEQIRRRAEEGSP